MVGLAGCASAPSAAPSSVAPAQTTAPRIRPSTASPSNTQTVATPDPTQPLATYGPAPSGGSGIQVAEPCDSGTLTVTAGPHGRGVAETATVKEPAHAKWFGGLSITPWRNLDGDPTFPRYTLTKGTLTLHATNLKGADALHNPALNYAWPQQVRATFGPVEAGGACDAASFLDATSGMVATDLLDFNIDRDTGVLSVDYTPRKKKAGLWQITAVVTSAHGSQQQSRTVKARVVGDFSGAPSDLVTQFSGFTDLSDFISVAVSAQKPDGAHPFRVTLTRFP